jgi:glycosyltransferase involved in cell wall biosynthesis
MSAEVSAPAALPRICIVSHGAWGAVTGGASGHAGGVEYQTALTARWLAARGFPVSLVVWNEGQPDEVRVEGVRVLSVCRRDQGLPGVRFVHPRWTGLLRALRAADADLYYHNCGEYVTGQVALWCRTRRRKFVFSVASDPECDPRLPALHSLRERTFYRYGLRHADTIIVQTHRQQRMLRSGFGLDSAVLPMPCAAPAAERATAPSLDAPPRFVWVGRISPEKRPQKFIEIARALPDLRFDFVGPAPDAWAREIAARAALPNVRVLGRVPSAGMHDVYGGAAGLICTSLFEGFPNTFIEAWSHGVPVVSSVDPDDLISLLGLGVAAADTDGLIRGVRLLATDRETWRRASDRSRAYYETHHDPEIALPRFAEAFLAVCGRTRPAGESPAVEEARCAR